MILWHSQNTVQMWSSNVYYLAVESGPKRGDWRSSLKSQREGSCQQLCLGSQPHDPCRTEKHGRTHKIQGSEDVEAPLGALSTLYCPHSVEITQPHHNNPAIPEKSHLIPGTFVWTSHKSFPFCVKMDHFRSLLLRDKITVIISKVDLTKLLVETIRLLQVTRNLTAHVW